MSSGFVSGGTTDNPLERDDEWLKAQQEIEANRRRKEEEGRQQGGRSLYEVLQNNKAAKQEAFEESIRLKNQFRTLDQDEVEFLDSVLESTRAKEDAVKKETTEQLDLFRRQQEEADRALLSDTTNIGTFREAHSPVNDTPTDSSWAINARKRKRNKEHEVKSGLKLRKSSTATTAEKPPAVSPVAVASASLFEDVLKESKPSEKATATSENSLNTADGSVKDSHRHSSDSSGKAAPNALGLAAYSSDEDE
ncbi:MAG: hypothetical protein Q9216_002038 [Gyalolechia sp. 2 TL-2023]